MEVTLELFLTIVYLAVGAILATLFITHKDMQKKYKTSVLVTTWFIVALGWLLFFIIHWAKGIKNE